MRNPLIILSFLIMGTTFCVAQNEKKQDKNFQNGIYATPETEPQRKPESDEIIFTYNNQEYSVPLIQGEIIFSKVYDAPSQDATQLYNQAKLCIADLFRSAQDVIQVDNPGSQTIVAKGYTEWIRNRENVVTQGFDVYFTLKIECRDNRYKLSIYNFSSRNSTSSVNIEVNQNTCYQNGFKNKSNAIRSNIFGLSWIAWYETAHTIFQEVPAMMAKSNKHDDW